MAIIVKIPRKSKYAIPNMCVCCGEAAAAQVPIFRYEVQFFSHSLFTFYVCNKCSRYVSEGPWGGRKLSYHEIELLPVDEKKRAIMALSAVGVHLPFFYLGKVKFAFHNDDYGMAFWNLNGGEMSEF